MMHRFLLAVACLLVLAAFPALAQPKANVIPQFIPASGWLVKPALMVEDRNLQNIKIPCMMMVEYDNGFTLRLSGGNAQLLAMAIDFRQDVFVRGKKYHSTFLVDGASVGGVKATAFDDNVLIFNARKMEGIYQRLQNAQKLTLDVEGNQFHFTLGNIGEAFTRLERCYAGDRVESSAGKPMPVGLHNAPMKDNALPDTSTDWQETRSAVSQMPHDTSMPASQPRRAKPVQVWKAKAGYSIKDTLQRWSNQADVELHWQASISGIVVEDMSMTGSFEEAVQSLLAQNAAATGLQADMIGGGMQSTSRSPQPLMPVSIAPERPRVSMAPRERAKGLASSSRWSVPAGSNLRRVLEVWSRKEGVELFWNANQAFAVKNAVSNNSGYTQALEELMGQYVDDPIRPIANLNTDPDTGRRILIIQSSRVL